MTNCLPEDEGARLRFDFEMELARLEAAEPVIGLEAGPDRLGCILRGSWSLSSGRSLRAGPVGSHLRMTPSELRGLVDLLAGKAGG